MLEVIKAVERVNGADFPVTGGPRRAGDPAGIVAGADRVRQVLGWQPCHADLDFIVRNCPRTGSASSRAQRAELAAA